MKAVEANFDGLVGPTHNYSGLSFGNIASRDSSGLVSNPREAAMQGLAKMKALADLGVPQGVLPPHDRPYLPELRRRGYQGTDRAIIERVARDDPILLAAVSSASAMWAANAATVSPSADTRDGRLHVTPANLVSKGHRAIEAPTTRRILQSVFRDEAHFAVHPPLPPDLADEGAANHTRLAAGHGDVGTELFAYGAGGMIGPSRYPGRQSYAASRAVADQHGVINSVLAQQHPEAIDAGVFHNDVIAVGNLSTLLVHEKAFVDQMAVIATLDDLLDGGLELVEVPAAAVSLQDAVRTYLFNSQLIDVGERQILLAPLDVSSREPVATFVEALADSGGPIHEVITLDLRQSMRNGGGPACLRLRVVLTPPERAAVTDSIWLTDELHTTLEAWIDRHYRTELVVSDLADPHVFDEHRRALDEVTRILGLGAIYEFQGA